MLCWWGFIAIVCQHQVTYRAVSFQASCWPFLLPGTKHNVESSLKMVTSSRESLPVWGWWAWALVGPWWLSVESEMSDEWPRWLEVEEELDAVERWPASGTFMVIGWSCPFSSNIPPFWCSLVFVSVDWCCCSKFFVNASCASGGSGTRWKRFSPVGLVMIDCGLLVDWLVSFDVMPSCKSLLVPLLITECEALLMLDDGLELVVLPRPPMASDGTETKAIVQLDRQKRN